MSEWEISAVKLQCQVLLMSALAGAVAHQYASVKYCKICGFPFGGPEQPEQTQNVYENKGQRR